MQKIKKLLHSISGIILIVAYALVLLGIKSVISVFMQAEFDGIIEKMFSYFSFGVILIFAFVHAYGDIKEREERKRNLIIEISFPKGSMAEKFFQKNGMDSYSSQLSFIERAVSQRINDIECGRVKD